MCGRIVIVWDAKMQAWVTKRDATLAKDETRLDRFGPDATAAGFPSPHYNVGPRWPVQVLVGGPARGEGRLTTARWGFPLPGQRKDVFNTQMERAFESPMWRGAIGKRHAVLPVTGFYEWDHDARNAKQPYFLTRADGEPMLLGAIMGERHVQDPQHDESMLCTSVVTVPPTATVAALHDRMPLILEESEVDAWLDPTGTGRDAILDLAATRHDVLTSYAVAKAVNKVDIDGAQLIAPDRTPRQGKLEFGE